MKTFLFPLITAIVALACGQAAAQDIFIGTLSVQGQQLILRRCDLVENTYTLQDAKTNPKKLVKEYLSNPEHRQGIWYAEVIGIYGERNGENTLEVLSLDNLASGKTCHLSEAIDSTKKQ
jgi:hypothetical protein